MSLLSRVRNLVSPFLVSVGMGVVKIHLGDDFWDSVDYFARELFCIKG